MLRLTALLLLLANIGYFAWSQGHLRAMGWGPLEEREPQRLKQQVAPEKLRVERLAEAPRPATQEPPAPAPAETAPAATQPVAAPRAETAPACYQANGFNPAQAQALRVVLATLPWANGRWTFGEQRADGIRRQQAQGLAIVAATWALTAGALGLLHLGWPGAPPLLETAVVGVATVAATAGKFVLMRRWVFRPAPITRREPHDETEPALPDDAPAGYPVGASGGVA